MSVRQETQAMRGLVTAAIVLFVVAAGLGYGCNSDSTSLGAQFTASTTATAPRLVKLQPLTNSGSHIAVQAVIYGPDTTLDMYSFDFNLKIGNPSLLTFVPNSAVAGNALTVFAGQSIVATATPSVGDASVIVVSVHKDGGGLGNGIAGNSAMIVQLTFNAVMAGTSTLAIAGAPTPTVKDSNGATIGTITFDTANGGVTSVSSGGGPY